MELHIVTVISACDIWICTNKARKIDKISENEKDNDNGEQT